MVGLVERPLEVACQIHSYVRLLPTNLRLYIQPLEICKFWKGIHASRFWPFITPPCYPSQLASSACQSGIRKGGPFLQERCLKALPSSLGWILTDPNFLNSNTSIDFSLLIAFHCTPSVTVFFATSKIDYATESSLQMVFYHLPTSQDLISSVLTTLTAQLTARPLGSNSPFLSSTPPGANCIATLAFWKLFMDPTATSEVDN